MRQTLRGIVARSDAPPSVRYVRRVSAWQVARSATFFIVVHYPLSRFTFDCLPCFDSLDYSTHSAICQDEISSPCFRFGSKPLFTWRFGLYHAPPVLSTMNLDFFKRILEFTEIVLISVCFELYYSYFSVQMFYILGTWDQTENCKPEFWLNRFTI